MVRAVAFTNPCVNIEYQRFLLNVKKIIPNINPINPVLMTPLQP